MKNNRFCSRCENYFLVDDNPMQDFDAAKPEEIIYCPYCGSERYRTKGDDILVRKLTEKELRDIITKDEALFKKYKVIKDGEHGQLRSIKKEMGEIEKIERQLSMLNLDILVKENAVSIATDNVESIDDSTKQELADYYRAKLNLVISDKRELEDRKLQLENSIFEIDKRIKAVS